MIVRHLLLLSVLIFAVLSCSPNSLSDFKKEGEASMLAITKELNAIHTREQLIGISPRLKELFNDIVDTIIEAREYQNSNPTHPSSELSDKNSSLNDHLRAELNRIYQSIEGGREVIETCQKIALNKLDAFEQKRAHKDAVDAQSIQE